MQELNSARFEDMLTFPAVIDFRIILETAVPDALERLLTRLNEISGSHVGDFDRRGRASSNGRYCSYRIPVTVADAPLLYRLYDEIGKIPGVKHVL